MTTVVPEGFSSLASELLDSKIPISFTANGNSMQPFIRNGDRVVVSGIADFPTRRGDVVAYRHGKNGLRMHRVLGRDTEGHWLIRGDASSGKVEIVPADDILGLVVSVTRDGKTCRAWSRRMLGIAWHFSIGHFWPLMWRVMKIKNIAGRRGSQ